MIILRLIFVYIIIYLQIATRYRRVDSGRLKDFYNNNINNWAFEIGALIILFFFLR